MKHALARQASRAAGERSLTYKIRNTSTLHSDNDDVNGYFLHYLISICLAMSSSEKKAELAELSVELEMLKGAIPKSEACKLIARYVKSRQDEDALVTPDAQNPFARPDVGPVCNDCTVS